MRVAGYPGSPYMYLRAASFPVYLRALAFALQAVGLASLLVALLQRQAPRSMTPPRPTSRSGPLAPVMAWTSSAKKASTPAAQGKNKCSWFIS